jgi:cupin fold WbuC family metalloprotein
MLNMTKKIASGKETGRGVYHAFKWGQRLETDLLDLLIKEARDNKGRKARYCVHPDPNEALQITYLAFINPYSDRIHRHPSRDEIVIPLIGIASHSTFDSEGKILNNHLLDGSNPVALTSKVDAWHSIEVLSEYFVMIEIGIGPFNIHSTVYL